MAQFRVEFVLDQSSGKYLAEMHNPENNELLVRTEALYPSQAAAVMGVIEMFKHAILQFPKKPVVRTKPAKKKAAKKKAAKKKPSKKKAAKRPSAGRRSRRKG